MPESLLTAGLLCVTLEVVVLFAGLLIDVVTYKELLNIVAVEIVFAVTATDVLNVFGLAVKDIVNELLSFVAGVVSLIFVDFGFGEGFGDCVKIFLTFVKVFLVRVFFISTNKSPSK